MNTEGLSKLVLHRLLSEILADQERLEEVARHSYRHQLGFEKIILANGVDGGCFRMHFWPTSASARMEDVHSHCASFKSFVVLGGMNQQIFKLESGAEFVAYSYRFNERLGRSEMSCARDVSLRFLHEVHISEGVEYFVDSKMLHKVVDVIPGTITFSRWGGRKDDAVVVKNRDIVIDDCVRYSGMSVSDVRQCLANVMELIK